MPANQLSFADYAAVFSALKTSIAEQMQQHAIPGLSIAIVEGNRLVWAEGFGCTSIKNGHPVTADTPFSLQSISKTYTTTGFLIAASQGLVNLDDPLVKVDPTFRVNSRWGDEEAGKITFRHLLSHFAGFPHEAPIGSNFDTQPCTFDRHIRSIGEVWLKFPVGQRYSYSNLGIDMVGYALQLITGKPFAKFMQEALFEPLGMFHTSFDQRWIKRNFMYARGHDRTRQLPSWMIPMIPSGGLFSSANDMARFLSFQLSGCRLDGKELIAPALLKEMRTPQFPLEGQDEGYGLGIAIGSTFGTTLFNHNGGGYGYLTLQEWIPEYNLGIAILTNLASHPNAQFIIREAALKGILKEKLGTIPEERIVRYDERSVIHLEEPKLRRLEGSYRARWGCIPIKVKSGKLTLWEDQQYEPVSETDFVHPNGRCLSFSMNAQNQPMSMLLKERWGFQQLPLDHALDDEPGPNKAEWEPVTGIYHLDLGGFDYCSVTLKNGYLCLSGWMDEARLHEYQPSLFFMVDGEAVVFRDGVMTVGNIKLVKDRDPYGLVIELSRKNRHHRRLREEALNSLGNAYSNLGAREKALDLFVLNAKLHLGWVFGLQRLSELYIEMDEKTKAKEVIHRILAIEPGHIIARKLLERVE